MTEEIAEVGNGVIGVANEEALGLVTIVLVAIYI